MVTTAVEVYQQRADDKGDGDGDDDKGNTSDYSGGVDERGSKNEGGSSIFNFTVLVSS